MALSFYILLFPPSPEYSAPCDDSRKYGSSVYIFADFRETVNFNLITGLTLIIIASFFGPVLHFKHWLTYKMTYVPRYDLDLLHDKTSKNILLIPVINEGTRLTGLLTEIGSWVF